FRTVMSSMVMPTKRQQIFGVSRCFHGMATSALFFGASGLSIYSFVGILTIFLSELLSISTLALIWRKKRGRRRR
ncbi:hypothetical protein PENTCL1PPCAC_26817, partial [Pristionchus entomophagus]